VHAGDFLGFLSRGYFNAKSHRVVMPQSGTARISFPLLMRPREEWRRARNYSKYNMRFDGDESSSDEEW
jgi:isopenicillin N synthase-like dioxygenase